MRSRATLEPRRAAGGRAARLLLVTLASALVPAAPRAQVSPAPLARAHAHLEGNLSCFKCHGKTEGAMEGKCLECHAEIAWLKQRGRGLHGVSDLAACASCHPDHGGVEFQLIQWPDGSWQRFDHKRAGWPLEGAHAKAECRACHQPKHRVSPAAQLIKHADPARPWTGLEPSCGSCHSDDDVHRGKLGEDCARCHDEVKWKPAAAFDHARTAYPLLGRHASVACAKCHEAPGLQLSTDAQGRPQPIYRPLPHAECSACHQDPHAGRLGPRCASCHGTDGWRKVEEKAFKHEMTRYPLRGAHMTVPCERCHDPVKAWGKRPGFSSCMSCHKDAHAGTASLGGRSVDCARCHDTSGWRPSTYTVARHEETVYPLRGRHQKAACSACHLRVAPGVAAAKLGTARVLIRAPHARCSDCHADAHKGQVAGRQHRGACDACHGLDGWRPSTFSVKEHAGLRLPLEGRHAVIACAACHGPDRKDLPPLPGPEAIGAARVALTIKEVACVACHVDPHEGRFAPGGARAAKQGCLACHGLQTFRPSIVDVARHATFASPLVGAHRATSCDGCHMESKVNKSASSLVLARSKPARLPFLVGDQRCEACHKDPHGGQFSRRKSSGSCASCHGEQAFKPAGGFDHERDSDFPLKGAHERVACARCHLKSAKDAAGRSLVIYRPVPRDCKSCHGSQKQSGRSNRSGIPAAGPRVGFSALPASVPGPVEVCA